LFGVLKDGIDATSTAYEVGYESVSQFNREHNRIFGQSPVRDIKAIQEAKVAAISAACGDCSKQTLSEQIWTVPPPTWNYDGGR
jgi:AraC-like DNA-binding protein